MAKHRIEIVLDDEEEKFIKWLAKYDNVTVSQELSMLAYTEIRETKELYQQGDSLW